MNRTILTGAGGVLLAVLLGYFLSQSAKPSTSQPTAQLSGSVVVQLLADRFEPANLTVSLGQTVCFMNQDSAEHWPASNDHPSHLIYPQFDPKQAVAPGSQWCFTFDRVGSWGFHDHLRPYILGTVIVTG